MADFIIPMARRWIDAGADAFVGHGPHTLRAIEIYKGKPIFYSLGNFFFTYSTIQKYGSEVYEALNLPESGHAGQRQRGDLSRRGGQLQGHGR